jgi:cytochrome c-type biogenesis protein CcmH/NrfF
MTRIARAAGPIALLVVVGIALLAGSGAFDSTHANASSSASTRITSIERDVKAPGTVNLPIADSSAPAAIALRNEIVSSVRNGETDSQILHAITTRWGTQILLLPPPGLLSTLLWVVPTALAIAAGVGGVLALVRHRRPS